MNSLMTEIIGKELSIKSSKEQLARLLEYADFNEELERVLKAQGVKYYVSYSTYDPLGWCHLSIVNLKNFKVIGDIMEAVEHLGFPIENWTEEKGPEIRTRIYQNRRFNLNAALSEDSTCKIVYTGKSKKVSKWVETDEPEFTVVCGDEEPSTGVMVK